MTADAGLTSGPSGRSRQVRYSSWEVTLRLGLLGAMCGILCGCGNLPEPYSPPAQRPFFEAPPKPYVYSIWRMPASRASSSRIFRRTLQGNTWRWTGKRPTIRLHLNTNQKLMYSMDFAIADLLSADRSSDAFAVRERSSSRQRSLCLSQAGSASKDRFPRSGWSGRKRDACRRNRQGVDTASAGRHTAGFHSGGAGFRAAESGTTGVGGEMKALAALAGAAFTVAACYGLGSMLAARLGARLRRNEKFPLAFVLGASVLHLAIFAVMALRHRILSPY